MKGSARERREGSMWFSPTGREVRKGRNGKGKGWVADVTRVGDISSHHTLSLSPRKLKRRS